MASQEVENGICEIESEGRSCNRHVPEPGTGRAHEGLIQWKADFLLL